MKNTESNKIAIAIRLVSDTQETDAFIEALNDVWHLSIPSLIAHAKRMERERDCYKSDVEVITKERDEARKSEMAAILEREQWKIRAEEKWGMRRELEELLGVKGTEQEEQFAKGVATLRKLISEGDETGKLLGVVRQALGSSLAREKFILEREKFILGLSNEAP